MEIVIRNWDKYNPKRDQKNYTWLRLNNDIITAPDLHGLTSIQKFIWVLVLCEASKKNRAQVVLNLKWMADQSGLKESALTMAITLLIEKGLICDPETYNTELRSCAVVSSAHTTPTNERTNERDERNVRDETKRTGRTGAKRIAFSLGEIAP